MDNISLKQAQEIAQRELDRSSPQHHFTLLPGDVQEFAFGWGLRTPRGNISRAMTLTISSQGRAHWLSNAMDRPRLFLPRGHSKV